MSALVDFKNKNVSETIVPIEHSIVDGIYNRTAFAKKDTLIVGCSHKKEGIAFLMSGTIKQIDGDKHYEIKAPFRIETKAGSQRYAFALTDCIYSTVHKVEALNVEDAEKEVFQELPQITRIRNSFKSLLLEWDIKNEDIQDEMSKKEHILEHSEYFEIKQSLVDGLGCFAKKHIRIGEAIAVVSTKETRFATARYVNHSDFPNAKIKKIDNNILLIATKEIPLGYEIFTNYKESLQCQE